MLELDGELVSQAEYCRRLGYSNQAINALVCRKKLSFEEAVAQYLIIQQAKPALYLDGKKVSVAEYCRRRGIKLGCVQDLIRRKNMAYEEAISYCENHSECCYDINNVYNLTKEDKQILFNFAKENNIKYKTMQAYIRQHPYMNVQDIMNYYTEKQHYSSRTSHRFCNIWYNMMDRCYNPKNPAYKDYGGRGISVYERWHIYRNFQDDLWDSYIEHCKEFSVEDTTIDRHPNPNGNYEPSNIRWATRKEQNNNRRNTIMIDDDESFGDFCDNNNLDKRTIWQRFKKYGWSLKEALDTPVQPRYKYYLPCGKLLKYHCNDNGYNYDIIIKYITKYSLQPHEALAKYLENRQ